MLQPVNVMIDLRIGFVLIRQCLGVQFCCSAARVRHSQVVIELYEKGRFFHGNFQSHWHAWLCIVSLDLLWLRNSELRFCVDLISVLHLRSLCVVADREVLILNFLKIVLIQAFMWAKATCFTPLLVNLMVTLLFLEMVRYSYFRQHERDLLLAHHVRNIHSLKWRGCLAFNLSWGLIKWPAKDVWAWTRSITCLNRLQILIFAVYELFVWQFPVASWDLLFN